MKTLLLTFSLCVLCLSSIKAQIGVNTTNPNASLDIRSSNQATPTNSDGILIPKIDEFPVANPTALQDGMMVYVTGNGTPTKGFYYWDNSLGWQSFNQNADADWYRTSSTISPSSINQNIYTEGNVAIGKNIATAKLDVLGEESISALLNINQDAIGGAEINRFGINMSLRSSSNNRTTYGYKLYLDGFNSNEFFGNHFDIIGNGSGDRTGSFVRINPTNFGTHYGFRSVLNGSGNSRRYGTYTQIYQDGTSSNVNAGHYTELNGTGSLINYGSNINIQGSANSGTIFGSRVFIDGNSTGQVIGTFNNIVSSGSASNYGSYNLISGSSTGNQIAVYGSISSSAPNNWAGYFQGRVHIGGGADGYNLPLDNGDPNQVLSTDGSGETQWIDLPSSSVQRINDLVDGKSDNDGTDDGSSIFLGIDAGLNDDGTDNRNIGLGYESLANNISGSLNTASGYQALSSNTSGIANTAIGHRALRANITGVANTAFGNDALSDNTGGLYNTALGAAALSDNVTGWGNTAVGNASLSDNTIGESNTSIGRNTLAYNVSGDFNTALGFQALLFNTTGSGNVALGREAGYLETGSNKLYIENTDSSTPLIYGEFDNDILGFNGNVAIGHQTPNAKLHALEEGTSGDQTIVAILESDTSNRPTLLFSDDATPTINSGMSIEYNGLNNHMALNNVGGTSLYQFSNDGDFTIQDGDLIIEDAGDDKQLRMMDNAGNADRVIIRQNSTNDIYIGDLDDNNGDLFFRAGGTSEMIIENGGQVGINTMIPAYDLEVNGSAAKPGGGMWIASSDSRLKQNIQEYNRGLADLLQIQPVTYNYNASSGFDTNKNHVGVIAQELKAILPEMVLETDTDEKYLAVDNSAMTYMLINAVKEQQNEIQQLKKEIELIKSLIKTD